MLVILPVFQRLASALCASPLLLVLTIFTARATAATLEVPGQFSTIQAAIDAASDGDVIHVAPGVYTENLDIQDVSVTLNSNFIRTGDPDDIANTIIDGGGGDFGISVVADVVVADVEVTIDGFTIRNADDGILTLGKPGGPAVVLFFLNGRITDTSDGIDFELNTRGAVRDSVFFENGDDAIDLDHKAEITIERNVIIDNDDDGIEIRLHDVVDPFEEGEVHNIVIRDNLIMGNGEDGIQFINYPAGVPGGVLTPRTFHIERNIIANNAMAGIGMMDETVTVENFEAAPIPEAVFLFNNTFVGNSHGLSGGANVTAVNNLIVDHQVLGIKNASGDSIVSYTLFFGNGENYVGSNIVEPTLFDDPLLAPDFELMEGSPAIDAGTDFFEVDGEVVLDLEDSEFDGVAPDLGAIEFVPEPGSLLAHAAAMATVAILACRRGRRRTAPGGTR
jgi:hypothetical protein